MVMASYMGKKIKQKPYLISYDRKFQMDQIFNIKKIKPLAYQKIKTHGEYFFNLRMEAF